MERPPNQPPGSDAGQPRDRATWAWMAAAIALLLVVVLTPRRQTDRKRDTPLQTAYWYWHQPFELGDAGRASLEAAGVDRLYVLAGTVALRNDKLVLISPQIWRQPSSVPVIAVFRVEVPALELLLAADGPATAFKLVAQAKLPAAVKGIQWDADVPTQRLPAYTRFLRAVHPVPDSGRLLSITALPDWLGSPDYAALCNAVDEVAPQFYGNQAPRVGREPPALWEAESLPEQVRRAAAGKARVWAGLPAYGRCLVADSQGRFVGVRHDLPLEALLDDPQWEIRHASSRAMAWEPKGNSLAFEDTLMLHSRDEGMAGSALLPAGTSLWFQWPRVEALRAAYRKISASPPEQLAGVCLYRWPAPADTLALPPSRLDTGEVDLPDEKLAVRLVRGPHGIDVRVENLGTVQPLPGRGVQIELFPAGGEVTAAVGGAWLLGATPASPLRADRVRFTRPTVRPGAPWQPCTIRNAKGMVRAELTWTGPSGTQTTAARLGAAAKGRDESVRMGPDGNEGR